MPTMDDIRADVVQRTKLLAEAVNKLSIADSYVGEADAAIDNAWKGWPLAYNDKSSACNAIGTIIGMTSENVKRDLMASVTQLGRLVARDVIAPVARQSAFEPVVWLTSNNYMPPLRSIDEAEAIWQLEGLEDDDVWGAFVEALESALEEEQVYMAQPEYDNALYVVNLAQWEHVDSDSDNLNDEWQVKA